MRFKVEMGAMVEVPIYEGHKRGKNWMAVIQPDPNSPGGLRRDFQQTAKGKYYYMINGLKIGDPVEFGADYYTGGGKKHSKRWYGIVRDIGEDYIEIRQCKTVDDAFNGVAQTSIEELEAEANKLRERIKEIEAEIEKIKNDSK